jgi:glucan biosynthesis protein C
LQTTDAATPSQRPATKSVRLHYLDWLYVLAVLGVFLFHAVHPFDQGEWHIKNAEQSLVVSLFLVYFLPWGMPFFYLMSGTNTWFALQRRTGRQYAIERVQRLLIPFVVGAILLSPPQFYLEWRHQTQTGVFAGSLLEFIRMREISFDPAVLGDWGYHLWFLGFLFAYSLIALPVFVWLKRDAGQRFTDWLAGLSQRRGGILLAIIPLLLVQIVLHPLYPGERGWSGFVFKLLFFISGYILYADPRFRQAIRRDRLLLFVLAVTTTLVIFALGIAGVAFEWADTPGIPGFYLFWIVFTANGWCWAMLMLYVGIRFLDFSNEWLQYARQAGLPFFLFHQPVILAIAFYVVQWETGIVVKLLTIVFGSFVITLGLYELVIRRVQPLHALFGIKPRKRESSAERQASG